MEVSGEVSGSVRECQDLGKYGGFWMYEVSEAGKTEGFCAGKAKF